MNLDYQHLSVESASAAYVNRVL